MLTIASSVIQEGVMAFREEDRKARGLDYVDDKYNLIEIDTIIFH